MSVVSIRNLGVRFGERELFSGLTFELARGELLAVLGPNGAGKTTLVRVLLGVAKPSKGEVFVAGGRSAIGYVPQQRAFDRDLPLRGRDLVRLGLDGHRWGFGRESRARIDEAIAAVNATQYADAPVGRLSGGEQQRLRIAQALVAAPRLLLVDEPLLSLDLAHQRIVVSLLNAHRERAGTPVVFVTHDVNPVLPVVDRVLYLAGGGTWALGTVDEVMTTETLSRLYGTEIDVLRVRDRIVVVGVPDEHHHDH